MTQKAKRTAVARLIQVIEDPKSSGRTVCSATRALALLDRLNLDSEPKQEEKSTVTVNLALDEKKASLRKRVDNITSGLRLAAEGDEDDPEADVDSESA